VRENVIISYRGANYELGQWPYGYGIWGAGTSQPQPLEGWPATPEGWSAAWYRFAAMEAAGTIVQVSQPSATPAEPFFGPQTGLAADDQVMFGKPEAREEASGQPADSQPAPGSAPYGQAPYGHAPYGQTPYGQPHFGQPHYGQPSSGMTAFGRPAAAPAVIGARRGQLAAALLAAGVVAGVIGLFPAYLGGSSLASAASSLVPHLIYFAAWILSAVLIFRGGPKLRTGALIGLGTSAVTFGLFFADAGTAMAGGAHLAGAGLWLGLVGWLACAAGSVLAFGRWPADWPRRLRGREAAVTVTVMVAALGAAIAFAPSWDSYTLSTSAGVTQSLTAGNAFANPAPIIVGDVAVMLALFGVAIIAALWRPARLGWALAAGAAIPMVAQAVSAIVMVSEKTSPTEFGISPSAAAQAGLKISAGLTGVFWAYCAFLAVLLIACAWLAASRDEVAPGQSGWPQAGPAAAGAAGSPVMTGEGAGTAAGYQLPGASTAPGSGPATAAPTESAGG
jgi:hypothetical protein